MLPHVVLVMVIAGSFAVLISSLVVGALLVARVQTWFSNNGRGRPVPEPTLDVDMPHSVPASVH